MNDSDNNTPFEEPKYHYSREERVSRIHRNLYPETGKRRWFRRKRTRSLIIILVDLVLIAAVFYFISKPANIFLEKEVQGTVYQLNIMGIRGKKVLVGFTVKNAGEHAMVFSEAFMVTVRISHDDDKPMVFRKQMESPATLGPGESSSVIFLLEEEDLPGSGTLELFFGDGSSPLFHKNVRF